MSMCDPVPLIVPEGQEPFVLYVVSILIQEERLDDRFGWVDTHHSRKFLWSTSFTSSFTLDEVIAAEMGDKQLRANTPSLTSTDPRKRFRSVLHTVYPVGISIVPTDEPEEPTEAATNGESNDHD